MGFVKCSMAAVRELGLFSTASLAQDPDFAQIQIQTIPAADYDAAWGQGFLSPEAFQTLVYQSLVSSGEGSGR
ncbi:hypothetical protein [Leptothoe sp. PORK10 BA2]|uniref:hypothetical protein n=1 Tax=Leptothoe sp. PORK10 BA2 TaxID=3110254 RepID=UPI002B1ECDEA|nr:hypothetical protein [Leptothoe sp. PORK10 BA2]MEA5466223.1 hypothetical protein [Leptothoe sp. PORK10 BA2]